MAHQRIMQRFARWHIWLGWLVGVPILMWTVTGLVMVARPIEEVRGEHLRAEPVEQELDLAAVAMPRVGEPIESAQLLTQVEGPVWIVRTARGATIRYSAQDGSAIPPLLKDEARAIADAAFAGTAAFESIRYFPANEEPLELRRGRPSWRVQYDDGTRIYVDDVTGEVLAFRTSWWRTFDFMFGLHVMDLQTRSDTHHPTLIIFATLGVIGSLLGCVLMFRRRKARVRR